MERRNQMEQAGLITRESAPPPVATTLYRLTSRGRDLEAVIAALGRWGAPLLSSSNADDGPATIGSRCRFDSMFATVFPTGPQSESGCALERKA